MSQSDIIKLEPNISCHTRKMSHDKLCSHCDTIIPFIPNDLLKIIADYTVLSDIHFKQTTKAFLTNNDKTLRAVERINGETLAKDDPFEHVYRACYPLSDTATKWSILIEQQPNSVDDFVMTFGVLKLQKNGDILDYREVRSYSPGLGYYRANMAFIYSKSLNNLSESGTIVTFDANLEKETISIIIDGITYENVFRDIPDLRDWIPYVDVRTYHLPIVVTIDTIHDM